MKRKVFLIFTDWIDPLTDKSVVDDETAQAWLHSGCQITAEVEIEGEEFEDIEIFKYTKGIVPRFYLLEV